MDSHASFGEQTLHPSAVPPPIAAGRSLDGTPRPARTEAMAGSSGVTLARLKGPPMDHASFHRIDCETDPAWLETAIDAVLVGAKTFLANCDLQQTESLRDVCAQCNYVFMILPYPNFTSLLRVYLRPERRKNPRTQPVEAGDWF